MRYTAFFGAELVCMIRTHLSRKQSTAGHTIHPTSQLDRGRDRQYCTASMGHVLNAFDKIQS